MQKRNVCLSRGDMISPVKKPRPPRRLGLKIHMLESEDKENETDWAHLLMLVSFYEQSRRGILDEQLAVQIKKWSFWLPIKALQQVFHDICELRSPAWRWNKDSSCCPVSKYVSWQNLIIILEVGYTEILEKPFVDVECLLRSSCQFIILLKVFEEHQHKGDEYLWGIRLKEFVEMHRARWSMLPVAGVFNTIMCIVLVSRKRICS